MKTPEYLLQQINQTTEKCIELGLCLDQQFPIIKENEHYRDITISNIDITPCLKKVRYEEMYNILRENRSFNMQLIDGALITMMYRFSENVLTQHRLSFFPSPTLLEFQNEPEIYSSEEIYADVIDNRVVPVPFRFDYDNRDGVPIDGVHPVSHLTIGQYTNCRIPVSSGLMPNDFVRFVLKHFYNTAFIKSDRFIPVPHNRFVRTLTEEESKSIYVSIPI